MGIGNVWGGGVQTGKQSTARRHSIYYDCRATKGSQDGASATDAVKRKHRKGTRIRQTQSASSSDMQPGTSKLEASKSRTRERKNKAQTTARDEKTGAEEGIKAKTETIKRSPGLAWVPLGRRIPIPEKTGAEVVRDPRRRRKELEAVKKLKEQEQREIERKREAVRVARAKKVAKKMEEIIIEKERRRIKAKKELEEKKEEEARQKKLAKKKWIEKRRRWNAEVARLRKAKEEWKQNRSKQNKIFSSTSRKSEPETQADARMYAEKRVEKPLSQHSLKGLPLQSTDIHRLVTQ
jgi:hypothetical protein